LLLKVRGISYDSISKKFNFWRRKMNWTQIADNYWVSPQLESADVTAASEAGIEVIVCNRPDNEGPDQINSNEIAALAEQNGLTFIYLPMQGPNFTPEYVEQVKQLNTDGKKVLAYCRSGNRSSILFSAAQTA
jgi:uncharacterized protein (TIGR01244 family)